jgi:hypothetical protein
MGISVGRGRWVAVTTYCLDPEEEVSAGGSWQRTGPCGFRTVGLEDGEIPAFGMFEPLLTRAGSN